MNRKRALFVTLNAVRGESEAVSTSVASLLRDYAARGYRIIVVSEQPKFGARGANRVELLAELRGGQQYDLPVIHVMFLGNSFDPKPFWEAARRFNLALDTSTFVSAHGELSAAARNAGIQRSEASQEVFGLAA